MDSQESDHQHVVTIWEINRDRLTSMQHKLSDTPKLLSIGAGRPTCSIFKVPQTLIAVNGDSYRPHIVSIGPFHHGGHHHHHHLQMIQEHKWRFLRDLLKRTEPKGLTLEHYLKAVHPLELKARECYSETIGYTTDEFVEMLVLDGCFVIELFRKIGGVVGFDDHDPIITMSWIFSFFLRDLIRLENQIPFFVLQCLFDLTKMPCEESSETLVTLALGFFNYAIERPEKVVEKYANVEAKHLLDLLRLTVLPPSEEERRLPDSNRRPPLHMIHNISKLRPSGIKLKPWPEAESFLTVNFKRGVIHMPTIVIDDFMSTFLLNSVAFEQCHSGCSKHLTTYVTLLDCLISTSRDVGFLCDFNIIANYMGTDTEVAAFINNMGKDISFDMDSCYLAPLFNDVERHYQNAWRVQWSSFRYTYFDAPWSFISAMTTLILLILAVIQTI